MGPVDYLVIAIIAAILGLATGYIVKAKKKGRKCIGCPDGASCSCSGKCASCSGCGHRKSSQ